MRLIHPECIAHADNKGKRTPIYAVDFQPNHEGRLATAGGG
jgi:hypothetical protein